VRCLLLLALVLVGCGSPEPPAPIDERGSADVPPPDDAWTWIEALAKPRGTYGPATDLDQALLIEGLDGSDWFELEFREPPPPLSEYPGGPRTIELLTRWTAAGGGLVDRPPPHLGLPVLGMMDLADLVIATATTPTEVGPAIYMGTLLVTAGHDLLAIQNGLTVLERAQKKLRTMEAAGGLPLIDFDVPRSLAADATRSVRMSEWYKTPVGAKDVTAGVHVPTDAEIEAYKAFWIRALSSATRGEPSAITRQRLRRAMTQGSTTESERVEAYLRTLDNIEQSLNALHPN
jgi:hypothetical protein